MTDRPIRGTRGERVYLRPLEPDDAERPAAHGWDLAADAVEAQVPSGDGV